MEFEKIIAIPGQPGLYKMVAQMRNGGFVVEALADGKRMPVSNIQQITLLKDIAVFAMDGDTPLLDVFRKMKEMDGLASSVDKKAEPEKLKSVFGEVFPGFDQERVRTSDIKKMFAWYGLLKDRVSFEEEKTDEVDQSTSVEETNSSSDAVAMATKPEKTKKKATADQSEADSITAEKEGAPKKTAKTKQKTTAEGSEEIKEKAPRKSAKSSKEPS